MRDVWALLLAFICIVTCFTVTVRADDGEDIDPGLGYSVAEEEPEELEEEFEESEEEEEPDIPAIHALMGISTFSISSQANYPYTGGCFIAANTNYGTGLMVLPENYKVNTFGFVKNTDRVVNLTMSTVNGYWIMGGTTYQLRFASYGQAEYYYNLATPYAWRSLTVSAITDTNIQFLDETGERGVQRPYLTLQEKIIISFLVLSIAIHAVGLFGRR